MTFLNRTIACRIFAALPPVGLASAIAAQDSTPASESLSKDLQVPQLEEGAASMLRSAHP